MYSIIKHLKKYPSLYGFIATVVIAGFLFRLSDGSDGLAHISIALIFPAVVFLFMALEELEEKTLAVSEDSEPYLTNLDADVRRTQVCR